MRRSLEKIYRRHRQGLYTLALSITRCSASAEDAVHDAFVHLWNSRYGPRGDAVAYVFAAVRNAAIEQVRKMRAEQNRQDIPVSIYEGKAQNPSSLAADAEREETIAQALEKLPDGQRELVVMRMYGSLKFSQIAEILGEPISTVSSRYGRALEQLRSAIGMNHE